MNENLHLDDSIIYQEMMSHPVLFIHPKPHNVVIIGDEDYGILTETLKHHTVTHVFHVAEYPSSKPKPTDNRVDFIIGDATLWISSLFPCSQDILIIAKQAKPELFKNYFTLLNEEGVFIQQSHSLFDVAVLKALQSDLLKASYTDIHFLNFPQPHSSLWRSAVIAKKYGNIRRIREKDVYNKSFNTGYYNFDIHKASLVLPEFMRKELEPSID